MSTSIGAALQQRVTTEIVCTMEKWDLTDSKGLDVPTTSINHQREEEQSAEVECAVSATELR